MLPALEYLGVRIHSDLKYAGGPVECAGQLEVMSRISGSSYVELECHECRARISVPVPEKRDMSWQNRKDLA